MEFVPPRGWLTRETIRAIIETPRRASPRTSLTAEQASVVYFTAAIVDAYGRSRIEQNVRTITGVSARTASRFVTAALAHHAGFPPIAPYVTGPTTTNRSRDDPSGEEDDPLSIQYYLSRSS